MSMIQENIARARKILHESEIRQSILSVLIGKPLSVCLSVCPSVRSLFSKTGHRTTMKFGGNIGSGDLMVHVKS